MAKLQKVVDKAALEEVEAQTAEKDEIVEDVEPHTRATSDQPGEKHALSAEVQTTSAANAGRLIQRSMEWSHKTAVKTNSLWTPYT